MEELLFNIAASYNSKETTELLLSHNANIIEKDIDEQTSLHYAACKNNKEIIEILISHGANINEKYGETYLFSYR
ncbi:ankyrin repeat protein, putative [Trichomonas vaginalis G3]|uniref:Ankyrin repeat protein, putative n=1 Tax=Trichomonas vaginalis (strain ATCC PRA-98 / G3) TaxID=412133 RepID=A2F721_TRIV3|nr:cyclin-dependent kinase inhibitor 2C-related family [Trichomonas vaginalis G3]EAX99258.1 ankyrin repeat protein, putative [Trichomonas vaginalis G3]KAI5524924.1 cyclin-dependent kinase inhibitor 2C-related family [Trichomonas vaginalis G3]|eukprot:XP_001312188.1 ankyrin repeat protein [Trichomonas vaginalis G3]